MNCPENSLTFRPKPLTNGIRQILAGGLLAAAGAKALADGELPVAVGGGSAPGTSIGELANPALHPNIDVGSASASYSSDGQNLTINQATDKVVLDWQSFDIGAGHSVQFVQPGSTSVALNNIHQLDASKIYGNLSANGQVYLLNANGFVFGKGSSVNVNSLVATTLKIEDEVFDKGIANVVDNAATGATPEPVAALTGDGAVYRDLGNGQREKIRILVENGASITAAKGGRVLLAAPEVENAGTITAPDGQTMLVGATDKVYLQASESADLRGLLVEVNTGGSVKNVGKILTERGNTTMMGFAVSQQGVVSATTSVALNGGVRLLAREGAKLQKSDSGSYLLKPLTTTRASDTGDGLGSQAKVTLAEDSITSVDLDTGGGTAVNEQRQLRSKIDIEGGEIRIKTGARVIAHGGDVGITASERPDYAVTKDANGNRHYQATLTPGATHGTSRVIVEQGSNIDVSGVKNVELAMSSNVVDVELRNYELRDAPLQKQGILHGATVHVDVRAGTTLADASAAIAKQPHSVFERNIDAGTIQLQSDGELTVQNGATLDISGGYLSYLGGYLNTTQLLSNNRLFDITSADPNRIYQKIINSSHYQAGYQQGGNAGTVSIRAQAARVDGNMIADTVNGLYQRDADAAPRGGELDIDLAWNGEARQSVAFMTGMTANAGENIADTLALTAELFDHGVNHFQLDTLGRFAIDSGVAVKVAAGGSFDVRAGHIDLRGSLIAPAGDVSLTAILDGGVRVAASGLIDTSGRWINDIRDSRANHLQTRFIDGGDIRLQAGGGLILERGSSLTANGGARLSADNKLVAGNGGDIALISGSAGGDPSVFDLGANLSAYALQHNGRLSISADRIEIANGTNQPGYAGGTLYLSSSWLENGNFGGYSLKTTDGALKIADGSHWQLRQHNWQLTASAMQAASGTPLSQLAQLTLLPDYLRQSVDLNLIHHQTTGFGLGGDNGILIGANAWIGLDWGAKFNLESDATIAIAGTLSAPSGAINIDLNAPGSTFDGGYNGDLGIVLAAGAHLLANGTSVLTPNGAQLIQGDVKPGGSVTLTANRGYIVSDSDSSIEVSGTQAALDIVNAGGRQRSVVASAAGTINLTAAEGLLLQGRLLARAGSGASAGGGAVSGGSIDLALDARNRGEGLYTDFPTASRVIHVSAETAPILSLAAGVIPAELNGQGFISVRQIKDSGADRLSLTSAVEKPTASQTDALNPGNGEIRFDGAVDLSLKQSLTLDAPSIGHAGNGSVRLSANVVNLGSSWNRSVFSPVIAAAGSDTLSVYANLINLVGAGAINQFAETRLISQGDIRMTGVNPHDKNPDLVGALTVAGDLTLGARALYPTTFSRYMINVDTAANPNGSVTILPANGESATPLSAAGQLTINAPNIASHGRLLAPFGSIELNAGQSLALLDGSVTSVSADTVIPFGQTQGGLDWLYRIGKFSNVLEAMPEKAITLSAPDIELAAGADINLNGGGDLSAYEFIAGAGGSVDVLDSSDTYAILPSYLADFAAYDPIEFGHSGLSFGDSIHLSSALGQPGEPDYLPAGDYVLLPAHYALLPNAFLITPHTNTQDMAAGTSTRLTDGTSVIAGYRYTAHTDVADSRWSGFAVESGRIARTRSEYDETTASAFFGAEGSGSPNDAGNLTLLAQGRLDLAADISATAAAGGLGGLLDIGANRISVVQDWKTADQQDGVVLLADQLNQLHVDSLLLGGRRQRGNGVAQLSVSADRVTIDDVNLQGRELLLAARDRVSVGENARLQSTGSLSRSDEHLSVVNADGSGNGALLRLSAAGQARVQRADSGTGQSTGVLDIRTGAILAANGSMLLDASRDTLFNGTIVMDGGDLGLGASRVTLGGNGSAEGLNLSDTTLNQLHADRITLNSYGSIDFAGAFNLDVTDLTLNAAAVRGMADGAQTATIAADSITLTNSGAAATASPFEGRNILNLSARKTLILGAGDSLWSGFDQVNLRAGEGLIDNGQATMRFATDLNVTAPVWTANAGANTAIDLGNRDLTISSIGAATVGGGLGARLNVNARDIDQRGQLEFAAGGVALNASRDLTVAGEIDVAGRVVNLADAIAYAGGGYISLTAAQGNLNVLNGARLDVSGSQAGGDAGSLQLSAANGDLSLAGSIAGHAEPNAIGGNLSWDSLRLAAPDFDALLGKLRSGGFEGDVAIRQHQGDMRIDAHQGFQAANLSLTADSGKLSVAGELSVSGAQAGKLQLAAGDELTILAGAKLGAVSTGAGKSGGTIELTSTDADGDAAQGVNVESGAKLDVHGVAAGGEVDVIVNRKGNDDAEVNIAAGSVIGAANMKVAAMAHYTTDSINNSQIKQWYDSSHDFMTAAAGNADLSARLGGFSSQPGLDVQNRGELALDLSETLNNRIWTRNANNSPIWSTKLDDIAGLVAALNQVGNDGSVLRSFTEAGSSNLTQNNSYFFDSNPNSPTFRTLFVRVSASGTNPRTLAGLTEYNGWDLALPYANGQDWHFGAEKVPGLLVIRAANTLNIQRNLSDGIARYDASQLNALFGYSRSWTPREVLQTGASWSYQLVAGADLDSANLLATIDDPAANSGHLTVADNARVRTGTGKIAIAAAGDIKLTDWTSAIYTMGRAETVNRYGNLANTTVGNEFFVEYPLAGGDLSLDAGGDIIGAVSSQFLSDWLQHSGQTAGNGAVIRATAWGIAFDAPGTVTAQNQAFGFRENIGALGGGNIDVKAGHDILNLSVMLPTTAKPIGAVDASGRAIENALQIRGGGDLNMQAGGDIAGGVFFVDGGTANIKAGGAISASRVDPDASDAGPAYDAGPIFAIGDAIFNVKAANGIAVGAVLNPFVVAPANFTPSDSGNLNSYFFNYSQRSGIALQSLAGNIDFNNDIPLIDELAKKYPTGNGEPESYLTLLGSDSLMPFYPGNLSAHALSGNIAVNNSITLFPSVGGTLDLAAWGNLTLGRDALSLTRIEQLDTNPNLMPSILRPTGKQDSTWPDHADRSVYADDNRSNRLIAAHGSIAGTGAASIKTAKATTFYAGLDVKNLSLDLQNLRAGDVSSISAGRDIVYPLIRDPLTGDYTSTNAHIELAGPGLLNVWAGRNIDLGYSKGITTVGNLYNVSLPARGADITVLAGNRFDSDNQALQDFLQTYIQAGPYQNLQAALSQQTTTVGRLQIALSVLFGEIRTAAKAAATATGNEQQIAYQRGYDAIARLFPDAPGGDIKLFFSRIQTLQGGDIDLLAPGGMINVGLASGFTGRTVDNSDANAPQDSANADLGIIAQRDGNINILVKHDLQVNQQRVFTLDGGDITAWSSAGDIDAGQGAKAALATAAPRISIDKTTGQLVIEFPPTIAGSGIRAQSGYNSAKFGDVVLAAPKGVVNAGEAGIGGQNVTIAATAVIGASNIQAQGNSTGFGQTVAAPTLPGAALGAAATAAKNGADSSATESRSDPAPAAGKKVKLPVLSSQLVGFGHCGVSDVKSGKAGCGG